MSEEIDYGPLAQLIGHWYGDNGMDVAPEEDGPDDNPYYENIVFTAIGDVENAERQTLVGLHYLQVVQRKSNDKVFHHETGYWLWDAERQEVIHSLMIPRAVGVLAAGTYATDAEGWLTLQVAADLEQAHWNILQSPFMHENARTKAFRHKIKVKGDELQYHEQTIIDIYGREFDHTDENILRRKA